MRVKLWQRDSIVDSADSVQLIDFEALAPDVAWKLTVSYRGHDEWIADVDWHDYPSYKVYVHEPGKVEKIICVDRKEHIVPTVLVQLVRMFRVGSIDPDKWPPGYVAVEGYVAEETDYED